MESRAVVANIGGDSVADGDWTDRVQIANPITDAENGMLLALLAVADRAVATSGGYRRGVEIAGRHYSHIVALCSARPAGHVLSATVAPDAVMPERWPLPSACCRQQENRNRGALPASSSCSCSRRWQAHQLAWARPRGPRLTATSPGRVLAPHAAEQARAAASELTITIELARFTFGNRLPYLAVWIDDADKFPVRTLALWFDKREGTRRSCRAWYREDCLRAMAEGRDIIQRSRARHAPPGAYTFTWDVKDGRASS